MSAGRKTKQANTRANREDGDLTKARIIEAAGTLFAERGYAETTSKEICELAQTSITAVNYHFGNREGLYLVVLGMMRDYISAPSFLIEMKNSPLSPKEKLAQIIDRLARRMTRSDGWQIRLWARETVSPSRFAQQLGLGKAVPRASMVTRLLAEATGLPLGSRRLEFCILNFISPIFMLLVAGQNRDSVYAELLEREAATIARHLKTFIFAGLEAMSKGKGT